MILYMVVLDDEIRYPRHNAHGRATYTTLKNAIKARDKERKFFQQWAERRPDMPTPKTPIIIKIDTLDGEVVE